MCSTTASSKDPVQQQVEHTLQILATSQPVAARSQRDTFGPAPPQRIVISWVKKTGIMGARSLLKILKNMLYRISSPRRYTQEKQISCVYLQMSQSFLGDCNWLQGFKKIRTDFF